MTLEDLQFRLEVLQREVENVIESLSLLETSKNTVRDERDEELPEELTSELIMRHYTNKSYSDLNSGIKCGKYPAPYTRPGERRVWPREVWDDWKRKEAKARGSGAGRSV